MKKLFIAALVVTAASVFAQQRPAPDGFVRIEGGTFMMGSPANEPERDDDEVQRQVTVGSFYMGKYEVTQIDKSRSESNNRSEYDTVRWLVTWNRNANGYRLPTEAEWEYACRAGTATPFNTGNNITTGQANYDGNYPYNNNAKGTCREKTTSVGTFALNPWGLYDMHGNVWEWCWDWYGSYARGAQNDPVGASSGSVRVARGGSWDNSAQDARSAYRYGGDPDYRGISLGFRLVRNG